MLCSPMYASVVSVEHSCNPEENIIDLCEQKGWTELSHDHLEACCCWYTSIDFVDTHFYIHDEKKPLFLIEVGVFFSFVLYPHKNNCVLYLFSCCYMVWDNWLIKIFFWTLVRDNYIFSPVHWWMRNTRVLLYVFHFLVIMRQRKLWNGFLPFSCNDDDVCQKRQSLDHYIMHNFAIHSFKIEFVVVIVILLYISSSKGGCMHWLPQFKVWLFQFLEMGISLTKWSWDSYIIFCPFFCCFFFISVKLKLR